MDIQSLLQQPTLGINLQLFIVLLLVAVTLKGFALWRASKKDSKVWFILLLLTNTLGILPLVYLIFSKK